MPALWALRDEELQETVQVIGQIYSRSLRILSSWESCPLGSVRMQNEGG